MKKTTTVMIMSLLLSINSMACETNSKQEDKNKIVCKTKIVHHIKVQECKTIEEWNKKGCSLQGSFIKLIRKPKQ